MLGIGGPVPAVLGILIVNLQSLLRKKVNRFVHGQYNKTQQRRTQESKTYCAQETQGGQAAEAPGLSAGIEEAKGQEDGPWPGEAVEKQRLALSTWHLATPGPSRFRFGLCQVPAAKCPIRRKQTSCHNPSRASLH